MWRLNGGSGASNAKGPDGATGPACSPSDTADIQLLLVGLSQLRLSVGADLSAAAGALEAKRPDIAADLISGAGQDLTDLQHAVWRRELQREVTHQLVASGVSDRGGPPVSTMQPLPIKREIPTPGRGLPQSLRRPGRLLAGVLSLTLAIVVAPHLGATAAKTPAGPPRAAAPATDRTVSLKLVSAEFTALRTTLQGPRSTPAAVLAAGHTWQSTLSDSLVAASISPSAARQIAAMLRLERTVILTSPRLRTAEFAAATAMLTENSDTLFASLRALATGPVRAAIPAVITALPTRGKGSPTSPATGTGTGTGRSGPSAGGSPVQPDPTASAGSGIGTVPETPTGATPPQTGPVPVTPAPVVPLPQLPKLPPTSLSSATTGPSDGLGQVVANALNALQLGG